MSTHLKLNFLVQCFNGSNSSETQSHDDSKEGVPSTEKSVSAVAAAFSYVRETTNIVAGIDERKRHETEDGCDFICDRKGINRGRGEGKQGIKRDERKDGVSKSHSGGERA
jgi:hypothetical protein